MNSTKAVNWLPEEKCFSTLAQIWLLPERNITVADFENSALRWAAEDQRSASCLRIMPSKRGFMDFGFVVGKASDGNQVYIPDVPFWLEHFAEISVECESLNDSDQANLSLQALTEFVHTQQTNAIARLDSLAQSRGVVRSAEESQANARSVIQRDAKFLALARHALATRTKRDLEELLLERRDLSHYFCVYCDDEARLRELTSELY